jgi:hypothetical protein
MYIKEVSIDGFKSYAQRVTLSNFDPGFNAITGLNGSGKSNILDSICFVMGIKNLSAVRRGRRGRGAGGARARAAPLDAARRAPRAVRRAAGAAAGSGRRPRAAAQQQAPCGSGAGARAPALHPPHPRRRCCHAAAPLQVRAQSLQELVYKQGSAGITKASVSITFHNDDPANGPSGYEDKELITVTRQVGGRGGGVLGSCGGAGSRVQAASGRRMGLTRAAAAVRRLRRTQQRGGSGGRLTLRPPRGRCGTPAPFPPRS